MSGDTPTNKSRSAGTARSGELALRLVSAAVLIPIGLASIWFGGWLLALFASLAAGAMAYEFSKMVRGEALPPIIIVAILSCLVFPVSRMLAVSVLMIGGAVTAYTCSKPPLKFSMFFGVVYAGGLALGVLSLRGHPDLGREMAMAVMLCTWASDTAAYFVGKTFGGPKLAPKDSPNKTWSGAIGAVIGATASGAAFGELISADHIWAWGIVGASVSVAAQLGDLFESQVKRRYGVKDTSGLLPGHGGVMDRVDGFGTAALIAVCALGLPGLAEFLGAGVG